MSDVIRNPNLNRYIDFSTSRCEPYQKLIVFLQRFIWYFKANLSETRFYKTWVFHRNFVKTPNFTTTHRYIYYMWSEGVILTPWGGTPSAGGPPWQGGSKLPFFGKKRQILPKMGHFYPFFGPPGGPPRQDPNSSGPGLGFFWDPPSWATPQGVIFDPPGGFLGFWGHFWPPGGVKMGPLKTQKLIKNDPFFDVQTFFAKKGDFWRFLQIDFFRKSSNFDDFCKHDFQKSWWGVRLSDTSGWFHHPGWDEMMVGSGTPLTRCNYILV